MFKSVLVSLVLIDILVPPEKSIPKFTPRQINSPLITIISMIVNKYEYFLVLTIFIFSYGIFISLDFSILFFLTPINKYGLLSNTLFLTKYLIITLVKNTMTKIVTSTLIINIVAKPRIELSPRMNKITAAIIVVMLASTILENEFLLPKSKLLSILLPIKIFSFILSKLIIEASTAIPIPRRRAAMPGNVKTPLIR